MKLTPNASGPRSRRSPNSFSAALSITGVFVVILSVQGRLAQTGRANITGVITDAQGGVIPGTERLQQLRPTRQTGLAIQGSSKYFRPGSCRPLFHDHRLFTLEWTGFNPALPSYLYLPNRNTADRHGNYSDHSISGPLVSVQLPPVLLFRWTVRDKRMHATQEFFATQTNLAD